MKIILFFVVGVLAIAVSWIVLAFIIFISRALINLDKSPEWHAQHASKGVSILHMIGSVLLGIWIAYRLVFQ